MSLVWCVVWVKMAAFTLFAHKNQVVIWPIQPVIDHILISLSAIALGYYLAGHLERTYDGMMIVIPECEWSLFQEMSTKRFAQILQQLAGKVDLAKFRKHKRGPKKPSSLMCQPPGCLRGEMAP